MESIFNYGDVQSDEEQENSNNSKTRDNSSTNNYGNYDSSSAGHSSSDTSNSRRRKTTDDTNYEEIQMELSEDSSASDASENHSSHAKVSDSKPKRTEADFISQSLHRSDKHKPLEIRSSSRERSQYKSDKNNDNRDRSSEKNRDKIAERHRNRDRDRNRDNRDREKTVSESYHKDRNRNDRYNRDRDRDRGRNTRSDKDDKYSRRKDSRPDTKRDRSDQKRDRTIYDKDRNRSFERDRDRRPKSKSRSRSRSRDRDRDRSNNSNGTSQRVAVSGTSRTQQHDRTAIKEPPKSLMSLQLPPMPLSTTSATIAANPIQPTAVLPKNIISPLLISPRYTEQMQKRKLLWGNKKVEGEQQQTTNNKWEQTKFSQDSDGKMASKFLRLMGMKDAPKAATDETQKAPDSIKKQNEMLSSMEQQYEVARQMTHTMRGMGLGFGTQPRHY